MAETQVPGDYATVEHAEQFHRFRAALNGALKDYYSHAWDKALEDLNLIVEALDSAVRELSGGTVGVGLQRLDSNGIMPGHLAIPNMNAYWLVALNAKDRRQVLLKVAIIRVNVTGSYPVFFHQDAGQVPIPMGDKAMLEQCLLGFVSHAKSHLVVLVAEKRA